MTTHTTVARGSDADEPEQPEQGERRGPDGDLSEPDAAPPASTRRAPSSLSGTLVPGTVLGISSLGAPAPRPADATPVRADVERHPTAVDRVDGADETTDGPASTVDLAAPRDPAPSRDLAEPAGLSEPAPLREPAELSTRSPAGDREVETAGSGSGQQPPSGGAKRGRGGGPKKDPEGRMALREHLVELRKRVVRAGVAILLGAVVGWFLYLPLIGYITEPLKALQAARDGEVQINFSNVASSFDLQVKGAIWIGVIVSSPLWIYQLWAFITPGLTKKERRYAVGFVSAAVPLFLGGVGLASLFIPRAVTFFTSFTPEGGSNIIDAPTYIGFVMRTVLTFGLAFLLPVILVALNFAGLLAGKSILKAWRWVLVAALAFAAIATPTPDITAMFILAAPIVVLFAIAILIALLHDRRKAKKEAKKAKNPEVPDDEASPL